MKRLLDIIFAITHPRFWNSSYNSYKEYDEFINNLLDQNPIVKYDRHTTKVGNHEIWTSNYPYAYGYIYGKPEISPYRRTRKRLRDYINTYFIKELSND